MNQTNSGAMSSRERLQTTLAHQQPDRVCVDFGSTFVTGIHASAVTRLRHAVLGDEQHRVKVVEPYQVLGEIDDALREALGIDVIGVAPRCSLFGTQQTGWKPFTLNDGTEVLVTEDFNYTRDENGDTYVYPEGDMSVPPSGRMPKDGWYFDTIIRQEPIDDNRLNVEDNLEEFGPISDEELEHFRREAERLYAETDKAIFANFGGTAFGDIVCRFKLRDNLHLSIV